eukprot:Nk52_evm13s257 gene=Nk52_evmTU13s257
MSIRNCVMFACLLLLPVQLVAGSLSLAYYENSTNCTGKYESSTAISNATTCWQAGTNSMTLVQSGNSVNAFTFFNRNCSSGGMEVEQNVAVGQCIVNYTDSFMVNSATRVFGQPFLSGPFAIAVALLTSFLALL